MISEKKTNAGKKASTIESAITVADSRLLLINVELAVMQEVDHNDQKTEEEKPEMEVGGMNVESEPIKMSYWDLCRFQFLPFYDMEKTLEYGKSLQNNVKVVFVDDKLENSVRAATKSGPLIYNGSWPDTALETLTPEQRHELLHLGIHASRDVNIEAVKL